MSGNYDHGGGTPNGENHLKFPFWLFDALPYVKGRKWKGPKLDVDGLSLLSEDSDWGHQDSRRTVEITKLDQDRPTNDNGSRSCWYLTSPVFQVVRQHGRSFECVRTSAERGNRWKLHPFGGFANSPPHLRVMMMVMIMIMTATMMMMALIKLVVIIMALKIATFSLTCKPKPDHFKTTF